MTTLLLSQEMARARQASDALFQVLSPQALFERPIAERHRLIFYLGHLEAFDRNLLLGDRSPQGELDRLFAFGIDPTQGDLPQDQPQDWPRLEQVQAYVQSTRAQVDPVLEQADPLKLRVAWEHRWMHCETLAYLFHRLPYELKNRPADYQPPSDTGASGPQPEWKKIPAGSVQLGQSRDQGFGWDNEFEAQHLELEAFEIESLPVSNGRYLKFVQAGGYQQPQWWHQADWRWIESAQLKGPSFWQASPSGWNYRGMFSEFPLPLEWPVYLSQAEASAYARWRGLELPSEAQYQRAAWSGGPLELAQANLDGRSWEPRPVGHDPGGASAFGVQELVGNGWEWTRSLFAPFPGFAAYDFYPGYSADFFDDHHFVLKGASPRTSLALVRPSFRNWFQPHYPYLYAKFRGVRPC